MALVAKTLYAAPAVEPVSLAEVKTHLRLDSNTFADSISESQSIKPATQSIVAAYGLLGTGVDVLGYQSVVVLNSGTLTSNGTVDVRIEESDDNATFTAWTGGSFTQVTTSNHNAVQEKEYTGTKQYIRATATVANQTAPFSVTIIRKLATHQDDTYLTSLFEIARTWVEDYTRRALITQTWYFYYDSWPSENYILVPKPPLTTTDLTVIYTDSAGTPTTWSSSYYIIDTDSTPGRIVLGYGQAWPSTALYPKNPIKVTAICGYGATSAYVPEGIKQTILVMITDLYENRGSQVSGLAVTTLKTIERLLYHHRVWLL